MKLRICLVVVFLILVPQTLLASTKVYRGDQTLFEDTVWSGDVLVDGILTVAAGVTLEIRPGTVIRFTGFDSNNDGIGEHEIFSQGTIRALGTAEKPILFTSAEKTPRPGDWGALNMMVSEEENLLQHCIVEYGYRGFHAHFSIARLNESQFRKNMRGAQFQESQVVIERCRFVDNVNGVQFRDSTVRLSNSVIAGSQWGLRCVYSDVQISGNLIEDNLINGINIRDGKVDVNANRIIGNRRGLYLQRSEGTVSGNDLSDNSEHGIFLEDSKTEITGNRLSRNGRAGVRWLDSEGALANNLIEQNGVYALINDGTSTVDARNNWWGTAEITAINASIRDGNDRKGMGFVDAGNALAKPLPYIQPETQ